jgi:hypothetical protein
MKHLTLKKLFCSSLMLLMIAACGKENKTGGQNGSYNFGGINLVQGGNQQSTQRLEMLRQWYNQNQEGHIYQTGMMVRSVYSANAQNNQNCSPRTFLGITFTFCSYSSSGSTSQTALSQVVSCIGQNNVNNQLQLMIAPGTKNGQYCSPTGQAVAYTKSSNVELAKVLSLNNGAWSLYEVQQVSQSVFAITVGPFNQGFMAAPTHVYYIDTAVHSVYNPVQVNDIAAGQLTVTTTN